MFLRIFEPCCYRENGFCSRVSVKNHILGCVEFLGAIIECTCHRGLLSFALSFNGQVHQARRMEMPREALEVNDLFRVLAADMPFTAKQLVKDRSNNLLFSITVCLVFQCVPSNPCSIEPQKPRNQPCANQSWIASLQYCEAFVIISNLPARYNHTPKPTHGPHLARLQSVWE